MDLYVPNQKVLYVDDEENLLSSFQSLMRRENVETLVLQRSLDIDDILEREGPFAVILSDQRMPGLDGVQVLERSRQSSPETVRILVTGYADYNDTLRAVNKGGISHYVAKPWVDQDLRRLVKDSVTRYNLTMENRYLVGELKIKNERLAELLDGTVSGTVRILGDLVGYANPLSAGQIDRVRRLGHAILKQLPNLNSDERWEIEMALNLFGLGLALLPAWIQVSLSKQGLAALDRFPSARNHHLLSAAVLKDIPRFEGVARIIRLQDRHFDGSGEPADDPARGNEIPLGARLLHILVDLQRLSSDRFNGRVILDKMAMQPNHYDVKLIATMLGQAPSTKGGDWEASVALRDLKPGMVLLQDVFSSDGQCLLKARTPLTETSINILLQWTLLDAIEGPFKVQIHEL